MPDADDFDVEELRRLLRGGGAAEDRPDGEGASPRRGGTSREKPFPAPPAGRKRAPPPREGRGGRGGTTRN